MERKSDSHARMNVSAVSYLNSVPFVYGLRLPMVRNSINLILDHPAECARKLQHGEADIGLTPIAAIPSFSENHIVSDFCIGANGAVRTVVLLSNHPLESLHRIFLDAESRTSVLLARVLAKNLWNKNFEWVDTPPGFDHRRIKPHEGTVAIGDKVFALEGRFKYVYDLAAEWKRMTGLPFVFATWIATKRIEPSFSKVFNAALEYGTQHIAQALSEHGTNRIGFEDALAYLTQNVSYPFTPDKFEAFELFLKLIKDITTG